MKNPVNIGSIAFSKDKIRRSCCDVIRYGANLAGVMSNGLELRPSFGLFPFQVYAPNVRELYILKLTLSFQM